MRNSLTSASDAGASRASNAGVVGRTTLPKSTRSTVGSLRAAVRATRTTPLAVTARIELMRVRERIVFVSNREGSRDDFFYVGYTRRIVRYRCVLRRQKCGIFRRRFPTLLSGIPR